MTLYRFLDIGEALVSSDEYFSSLARNWLPIDVAYVGMQIAGSSGVPYITVRRKLEDWAAVRAAVDAVHPGDRTESGLFWCCGCDTDYIHSNEESTCWTCRGDNTGKQPSLKEVLDWILREENK